MLRTAGKNPRYRKPVKGWKNRLAKIKIGNGSHGEVFDGTKNNHELCIMEAVNYIQGTGYIGAITDAPPCVSDTIRDVMIEINDDGCPDNPTGDRRRARLKGLVPTVIGTAPTNAAGLPITNPSYQRREKKRRGILADFIEKPEYCEDFGLPGEEDLEFKGWAEVPFTKITALIEEMAAVK